MQVAVFFERKGGIFVIDQYAEAFAGHAEMMLGAFVDWASSLPQWEQILTDLTRVNDALAPDYQAGMREAYEAAVRLMQVAEQGPFAEEVTYLFGSLVEAWGLAGV